MNNSAAINNESEKYIMELSSSWKESGIEEGDVVLVHSSLSRFIKFNKDMGKPLTPSIILESFIRAVGSIGTLIFPTYNFDFTKGKPFDIKNTKSETGALTEAARLHPDSVRTGHPLFSFAVIGFHKDRFEGLYNYSAFGKDSPFAILLELDGKIAALDVAGENCMTFYHHAEEMENAPNRYHKIFRGQYIDYDGTESIREFNLFARNLEMGVETDVKPMEENLWQRKLYKGSRPGEGSCLHVIDARTVYDESTKIIREGKSLGMLYRISRAN